MASIFDQKRGSKKCCFLGSKNDKKWRSKFDCNEGQKLCAIKNLWCKKFYDFEKIYSCENAKIINSSCDEIMNLSCDKIGESIIRVRVVTIKKIYSDSDA